MHQDLSAIWLDQLRKGFLIASTGGVQIGGFIESHGE